MAAKAVVWKALAASGALMTAAVVLDYTNTFIEEYQRLAKNKKNSTWDCFIGAGYATGIEIVVDEGKGKITKAVWKGKTGLEEASQKSFSRATKIASND